MAKSNENGPTAPPVAVLKDPAGAPESADAAGDQGAAPASAPSPDEKEKGGPSAAARAVFDSFIGPAIGAKDGGADDADSDGRDAGSADDRAARDHASPTGDAGEGDEAEASDEVEPVTGFRIFIRILLVGAIAAAVAMTPWSEIRRSFAHFPPPSPTGPYETRVAEVEVPDGLDRPRGVDAGEIKVRIFYPVAPPSVAEDASRGGWPLLIYMPGYQAPATDNDPMLLNLASWGYVVVAVDDIYRDEAPAEEAEARAAARRGDLDWSSVAGFEATQRMLRLRTEMSADKAIRVLDGLVVAAHPDSVIDFPVAIDIERVGALGFSFGGAAATDAMARDERIRVAINMDGGLYGIGGERPADGAYLELRSTEVPIVLPGWISWARPRNKFGVFDLQSVRAASRMQLDRPDAHLVVIWGAMHADFSATLYDAGRWRRWRPWRPPLIAAERLNEIRDLYVRAFLQTYLEGRPHELIRAGDSPFPEVRTRP